MPEIKKLVTHGFHVLARVDRSGKTGQFYAVTPMSSPIQPGTVLCPPADNPEHDVVLRMDRKEKDPLFFQPDTRSSGVLPTIVTMLPAEPAIRSLSLYLDGALLAQFAATEPVQAPQRLRLNSASKVTRANWFCLHWDTVMSTGTCHYHVAVREPGDRHWQGVASNLRENYLWFIWPTLLLPVEAWVRVTASNGFEAASIEQLLTIDDVAVDEGKLGAVMA